VLQLLLLQQGRVLLPWQPQTPRHLQQLLHLLLLLLLQQLLLQVLCRSSRIGQLSLT
jgi:hypothetical protein